jgi:hypothetical protein
MDVKHHFRQPVSYILTVHLNKFCIMFHFRGNRHALILVYNNIPRVTIDIKLHEHGHERALGKRDEIINM